MRPLPILASSADLGIDLQSVAEAASAALAEPPTFQFTGTLAGANHPAVNALASERLPAVRATGGGRPRSPGRRERVVGRDLPVFLFCQRVAASSVGSRKPVTRRPRWWARVSFRTTD